ncbi:glycosyltransferase [Ferrovibrio sp.]|uniref:glycosyltransferase n=1 Tax=Ferrovibrio sp. TaxID=1917215 RepID=UPI003D0984C5
MKILLISFAFPPYNASGSVRAGLLAEYLLARGHDVRVLTAHDPGYPATMASSFPPERVVATGWLNVFAPHALLRRARGGTGGSQSTTRTGLRQMLINLAKGLIGVPDGQIGWYPAAIRAGRKILRGWQPDLIYSTALPFTDHLIGHRLSQHIGARWVAEYRDLFTENPYGNTPDWRQGFDGYVERRVLAPATACVTVSALLAESLERRYGKRTAVVMNGYDPTGYASIQPTPELDPRNLSILYTGIIYPGRRDPTNLFAALALLSPAERAAVKVYFYGQELRGVEDAARQQGVADCVIIRPPVPLRQAQMLQANADILLLLLWNDPRERGVFTGKLFEYAGAGRPILTLGCEDGVAADLIRERGLGKVLNEPQAIAMQLRQWLADKAAGGISPPPIEAKMGLSRAAQFDVLMRFLSEIGFKDA